MSKSTSNCWSLSNYNPWPGIIPGVPSSNSYSGGFGVSLMLKDLRLATAAAQKSNCPSPIANATKELYALMESKGLGEKDFAVAMEFLSK